MVIEMKAEIRGLKAFVDASGWDVLVQPEMDDVLNTVEQRVLRPSKGLGARRNQLSAETTSLQMHVMSTRIWPRTQGTSWGKKNIGIVRAVLKRAMEKAIGRMTARWAAGGSG